MTTTTPQGRALGLVVLWAILPGLAWADPAMDADADEISQEYCGNVASRKVTTAADALMRVGEVWHRVSEVYESTHASYLLYWRGVLAQCLGQEAAKADLEGFIESEGGNRMLAPLAKEAKARLARIGRAQRRGTGPAPAWLRAPSWLELGGSWAAGGGASILECTDNGGDLQAGGQIVNTACAGGRNPFPVTRGTSWPARFGFAATVFAPRFVGLRLDVQGDFPRPNGLPTAGTPNRRCASRSARNFGCCPGAEAARSQSNSGWVRVWS